MSHPPRGLRPASPSVTRLGTTTALPWRTGRSLKSSSTPRPFSTQVAPRPSTGFPPHHVPCPLSSWKWLPCVHRDKCDCLSKALGRWSRQSLSLGGRVGLALDGQLDSCWGQGRWVGSRGFPLWFLQLRAAGQPHAQGTTTIRPLSLTAHCNAFKPTLSLFSAAPWGPQGLTCVH